MSVLSYLRETRAELSHVSWPTKRQATVFSVVVVIVSVLVSLFLGFFDLVFSRILNLFI
ncbi:MAG TPA: preprotein translocase subunit SecE [Candidatus Paceibacterota bacterium]